MPRPVYLRPGGDVLQGASRWPRRLETEISGYVARGRSSDAARTQSRTRRARMYEMRSEVTASAAAGPVPFPARGLEVLLLVDICPPSLSPEGRSVTGARRLYMYERWEGMWLTGRTVNDW